MTKLEEKAKEILAEKERTKAEIERRIAEETAKNKAFLKSEFEKAFASVLDMLVESGISYEPGMNDERYTHKGTFIEFRLGANALRMDFSNANSYRYCYTSYSSNMMEAKTVGQPMVYGQWEMDKFIVWIYKELLGKEEEVAA